MAMKKLGKITLEGASGASYRFSVYPWDAEFGAVSGVYMVTKRRTRPGGRHTHSRIYAGQTGDLSAQVSAHRRSATLKDREANCVCVHAEPAESTRLKIESDLMLKFRPPCNESGAPAL